MSWVSFALSLSLIGQAPAPSLPLGTENVSSPGGSSVTARPTWPGSASATFARLDAEDTPTIPDPTPPPASTLVTPNADGEVSPMMTEMLGSTRKLFQSDHEFDGFTGPMSNFVQFKDPRSLTEARFTYLNNYARPSTPVLGGGTFQVYALQFRVALTDRLQVFADKDGIVRLSPKGGNSVTGLANINAGLKYALIRNVERQFLFSSVIQFEPPTGYANIFQRNGSGLLGIYGVFGKEFAQNWHLIGQFGQAIPMQNQQSGYFMADLHLDRRFGRFTPFYEANMFYYNIPGKNLPLGVEGGGLINLGSRNINGMVYVTNAVGMKVDLAQNLELGLCYEFQVSNRTQLLNNMLLAQLIFRY